MYQMTTNVDAPQPTYSDDTETTAITRHSYSRCRNEAYLMSLMCLSFILNIVTHLHKHQK